MRALGQNPIEEELKEMMTRSMPMETDQSISQNYYPLWPEK